MECPSAQPADDEEQFQKEYNPVVVEPVIEVVGVDRVAADNNGQEGLYIALAATAKRLRNCDPRRLASVDILHTQR
jgi:hypothetical protein